MIDAPLSVLLSQVLLAFTIEFDNEFELQMSKTYARPFKVSIAMWSNFMRYVRSEGTSVGEIAQRRCSDLKAAASVVGGMERWGYITVDHDPATGVPPMRKGFGSAAGVKASTVIWPSMVGVLAIERWTSLVAETEGRWRTRFGDTTVERLRDVLRAIDGASEEALPRFLPIVGGLMFADVVRDATTKEPDDELPALLARVLLAFTLECEHGAPISLPIGENVLRVLGDKPFAVKDLPMLTGVSKEAVSTSLTTLRNLGATLEAPAPGGRGKAVTLTSAGGDIRRELERRISETEARWDERFGLAHLRGVLAALLDHDAFSSGLVTPPGGWRAEKRYAPLTDAFVKDARAGLPRYPMVLHRGGWPDGS